MPSRGVTLTIVLFWLAMSGLFFAREIVPGLLDQEPTLFTIEIIDEAGSQNDPRGWTVTKNGAELYTANTDWLYYPGDDSFESALQLWRKNVEQREPARVSEGFSLPDMPEIRDVDIQKGAYRIARNGHMEHFDITTTFSLVLPGQETSVRLAATIKGNTDSNHFAPVITTQRLPERTLAGTPPLAEQRRESGASPLSWRGYVLNPLHPLRRLPDLHAGDTWQLPFVDPFALHALHEVLEGTPQQEALQKAGFGQGPVVTLLTARVLPETQILEYDGEDVNCQVLECRGEAPSLIALKIWVQASDGVVLQHEVDLYGDSWIFLRRTVAFRAIRLPRPGTPP